MQSYAKASAFKTTYAPLMNRAALTGNSAIEQMADDMRVFAASAGGIDDRDLELLGYTPGQINAHGRNAARMATAQSVRRC